VHVIPVRKPVTLVVLALATALMTTLLYLLSGRAYAGDQNAIWEMAARFLGYGRGPLSRHAFLAFLMPILANVLLFVPWGFFSFLLLDSPLRPRRQSYALTILGAVIFAVALYLWQHSLPTRVTTLPDAIANGAGALAGAALGHARKSVRIRFDF
jgi:glycopeptide antibiotics resistance protein